MRETPCVHCPRRRRRGSCWASGRSATVHNHHRRQHVRIPRSPMTESATDPAVHRTEITVRWSDMDEFKHVNHARMVTLLEEARIDWLGSVDPEVSAMLRNSVVAHL